MPNNIVFVCDCSVCEPPKTTMPQQLTAIDPGITSGFATFTAGELIAVHVFSGNDLPAMRRGTLVLEVPRVYPGGGKGDPNDIILLALRAGELRGRYAATTTKLVEVTPRTWKGTVPKTIHHERVLSLLTNTEREQLGGVRVRVTKTNPHGYDHNALDAVGLGLWFLRRNRRVE